MLRAAEQRLTDGGAVVLRYDAEAYESLDLLAQALLTLNPSLGSGAQCAPKVSSGWL